MKLENEQQEPEEPALLAMEYEFLGKRAKRWIVVLVASFVSLASLVVVYQIWVWAAIPLFLSSLIGITAAVAVRIYDTKQFRCYKTLRDRAEQVPYATWKAARDLYWERGNLWWMVSAVECWEAHIPGDCPLCGAE